GVAGGDIAVGVAGGDRGRAGDAGGGAGREAGEDQGRRGGRRYADAACRAVDGAGRGIRPRERLDARGLEGGAEVAGTVGERDVGRQHRQRIAARKVHRPVVAGRHVAVGVDGRDGESAAHAGGGGREAGDGQAHRRRRIHRDAALRRRQRAVRRVGDRQRLRAQAGEDDL